MRTRAAVFVALDEPLEIDDFELTAPGPGEVVVRYAASGVCHTDRHVISGGLPIPPPLVLGHEGAGVVEEVGPDVSGLVPGDTVIALSAPACGACWFCIRGEGHTCAVADKIRSVPHLTNLRGESIASFAAIGTFSERATLHRSSVVKIESTLPMEQLALVGCGVLTGVGAVLTSPVRPGGSVMVMGCGGVGLSVVQGAKAVGASTILAVDPLPMKREAALALGATDAVDPGASDLAEVSRSLTGGRGVDVAFDAYGAVANAVHGLRATRKGGTTVMIGVPEREATLDISAEELLYGRKVLVGSLIGGSDPRRLLPDVVALAEAGRIDLAPMVSRRIQLDEVNEAFAAMDRGEVLRSVIVYPAG